VVTPVYAQKFYLAELTPVLVAQPAGVGIVTDTVKRQDEFMIDTATGQKPATEVLSNLTKDASIDDSEYFVKVKWIKHVKANEAVKERGFFGNQNIVARPRKDKWDHTVQRLKQKWGIE
jgi:predicted Zn-dependent protease